jgi:hypothetical protein
MKRTVQVTVTLQGVAPDWWETHPAGELKERIETEARRAVKNHIGDRLVSFTVTATASVEDVK